MKRERTMTKLIFSLLVLGSTLAFLTLCMAEDPDPDIPSEPLIRADTQPILDLPFKIGESGSYCLTANLTHLDPLTNAIEVEANNVTIDLCGYSITGPTIAHNEMCSGIYMNGRKNVEIRNGTVRAIGLHSLKEIFMPAKILVIHKPTGQAKKPVKLAVAFMGPK